MLTETHEAIQGQRQSWNLIKKLGEGDAGEVYLVESVLDGKPAIVKRPRRGSFFSDILRQASQIKTEGEILRGLQRITMPSDNFHLHTPSLIDQNKSEYGLNEQTFIIIEEARGLNIKVLSQAIHFGAASIEDLLINREYGSLIQQWAQFTEFPAQLLIRILLGVLNFLETIHTTELRNEQGAQLGVIWNDIKPDHLYWNPMDITLTFIDWGNSQFLGHDRVTKDRKYTALDDFRQFIQEMGIFIAEVNPKLYAELEWPDDSTSVDLYELVILPLKAKLLALQEINTGQLHTLRQREAELYGISRLEREHILEYEALQRQLAAFGEIPNTTNASNFMQTAAYQKVTEFRLAEFEEICENAALLPSNSSDKWKILKEIGEIAGSIAPRDELAKTAFSNALAAGVAGDWSAALWELFEFLGDGPRPDWWEKISQEARRIALGLDPETLSPYTMFARVYFTLRAEVDRRGSQLLQNTPNGNGNHRRDDGGFHWQASEDLIATVREEIIKKWKEIEPNPPDSGIRYSEVDSLIDRIEGLLPGSRDTLEKSLAQPRAQVDLVLRAWEQKDFELARRGLRAILLWDPDRARLFIAEKAIGTAAQWLARVRKGAGKDEPFYDYLTSVELAGRTLRNRVGPAKWLDETLEAFKRLRRGTRSVDLLMEYPEISNELPWLNEYQSREILSLPHTHPLSLVRDNPKHSPAKVLEGVVEGRFGSGQNMVLAEALDIWLPEARGSSARVFAGTMRQLSKKPLALAFKLMRPNQAEYALPLFIEEIQILTMLGDVPGITPMVACGFIKIEDGLALPSDESHASAEQLAGQVIHYGIEQAQNFIATMDRQLSAGWLPYLALVRRNPEHNLLRYCDASFTHGWFLPLRESLILCIQICDILQFAHDRNIVYRDHTILHYYWDAETHGVAMIDWNIAKRQPQGLSDADKQLDLVQLGARGFHHILTGRPAQGSLPLGANKPEEIEKASTHYPVNWTYDDERLPNQLRTILETVLNQGYTQVGDLRKDLLSIYQQLPGSENK